MNPNTDITTWDLVMAMGASIVIIINHTSCYRIRSGTMETAIAYRVEDGKRVDEIVGSFDSEYVTVATGTLVDNYFIVNSEGIEVCGSVGRYVLIVEVAQNTNNSVYDVIITNSKEMYINYLDKYLDDHE